MEDNKERNENELQPERDEQLNENIADEKPEAEQIPSTPKKPPMNKKLLIGIIGGAVILVAAVIALVLLLGGNNEHTCSFGEWTVITNPGCTEAGSRERVCSCGEKETEAIPAPGHDWKAANCQSPKICNSCYATEGNKASHAYTESIATPDTLKSKASCTSAAVYYKSCICGEVSESDADTFKNGSTTAHNYVMTGSTEADCESAATETYACDCGSGYTDTIGDALGHSISGVTPVEKAVEGSSCEYVWVYTCTADGCGKEVEGEHLYHHNYIASITTYPTCKDDGVKTLTCSCGDSYTETIEKDGSSHNWLRGDVTDGARVDRCEHCSETRKVTVYEGTTTDSINSGDLKDTDIEINDANISLDDGVVDSIGDKSVTISAEKFENEDKNGILTPEQLAQVGDSPVYNFTINDGNGNISKFGENNFVTITLPYTLQEGEDIDSIAIWFIDNNGELESIKAVYNNGYVTFKTNHFSYYTVTRLTPAQRCELYGHSYSEQSFEGSCTADGYTLKVCVRCHKSEKTITSVADGHDFKTEVHEAGCTENGYTVYSCKDCNYSYTKTQAATGHIWEAGKKEESTCSKNGYESFECKNCDESYTVTLPKLDHEMVEEKIIKEATCVEKGSKIILCVCGESVYLDIPATGIHSYENGVCKHCGQASNAAVKLDGIVVRIENLSYSLKQKENEDSEWKLTGEIEQVDLAELMIYVEDGKLYGAAIGSVNYVDRWSGSTTNYALTAIIQDGFLYYHIDNTKGAFKNDVEGKMSIEELFSEAFDGEEDTVNQAIAFCKDTLIPALEAVAKTNSESIDQLVGDALNILFTTENKADGSRVISFDHSKLKALNENLATLTVAEVIELYFGEGTVDKLYNSAIDTLNTVITDIPGIITEQGVDVDKLIEETEGLLGAMGLPVEIDIGDILYGEDYSEITIGMLIFGTEDKSYEEEVKKAVDILRDNTLYQLISPENPDNIKKTVDGVIDLISDKTGISFTINSAGQLVGIGLDISELTVESARQSHYVNGNIDISFTGRIDVSWSDIINEINGNIFTPDDEMLDRETVSNMYNSSGSMTYKGNRYYYEGQTFYSYVADYDRMLSYISESNCGDFRRYSYGYATVGFELSIRSLKSDYDSDETLLTIIVDTTTNETVELEMKQNGATAIYSDGSTKELASEDLASPENLYKIIFGGEGHDNFYRQKSLYFYYNDKTGEYSDESMHYYNIENKLDGESCEDGVTTTHTCTNCGYSYSNHYDYHRTNSETLDLTQFGACAGTMETSYCACGENFNVYFTWNICGENSYNEYYDDFGRLVQVNATNCRECGLRTERSYYTADVEGACKKTTYYTVVVSIGDELIINKNYTNTYESHDYEVTATLNEGAETCEDGVTLSYRCRDCGDFYTNNITWHETYVRETIDFSKLGSVCGGYAEITGCACGYRADLSLNHSLCELNSKYCELWIDGVITGSQYTTEGYNWYYSDSYIYVCAVTDPEACPFKIRYASYWKYDGDCTVSRYRTWQLGYNEETGSYMRQVTIKAESRNYHMYKSTEIDGGRKYECPDCGSNYSEINYYDGDGNHIKSELIAVNTLDRGNKYYESIREYTYDRNGRTISDYYHSKTIYEDGRESLNENKSMMINGHNYTLFEYYSDGSYWYRYEYEYDFTNGCNRTCEYTNSNGESRVTSENCCRWYWTTIENPTCSQDGIEGQYCAVCNGHSDTYTVEPTDHNWVWISDNHYYCFRCGLENSNGISGDIILEELTEKYGNGTDYVVGYYARNNVSFTYFVSLVLEDGSEIILEGIKFTESDEPRAIYFSKSDVERAIANAGYSIGDGDVRFAFVPKGSDGSLDYAITFTETVNIDTIVDDVSFVEYVGTNQTLSFTILPSRSGMWTFTSMATSDTYGYLYDAEGYLIASNDDGGHDSNFRLECYLEEGVSYTVSVKWYNSETEGQMPLIFTFVG